MEFSDDVWHMIEVGEGVLAFMATLITGTVGWYLKKKSNEKTAKHNALAKKVALHEKEHQGIKAMLDKHEKEIEKFINSLVVIQKLPDEVDKVKDAVMMSKIKADNLVTLQKLIEETEKVKEMFRQHQTRSTELINNLMLQIITTQSAKVYGAQAKRVNNDKN